MCTGRIPSTKGISFAGLVEKFAAKKQQNLTKLASKEDDEAPSSGQPEWEGKKENNNDPDENSDEKDHSAESEETVKEAETEVIEEKVAETEESEESGEKSSKKESDEAPSSGQLDVEPLHQKGESEAPGDITAENKKTEASATPTRFVKIAKLNDKTRKWLHTYWRSVYPEDYVDALLADYH